MAIVRLEHIFHLWCTAVLPSLSLWCPLCCMQTGVGRNDYVCVCVCMCERGGVSECMMIERQFQAPEQRSAFYFSLWDKHQSTSHPFLLHPQSGHLISFRLVNPSCHLRKCSISFNCSYCMLKSVWIAYSTANKFSMWLGDISLLNRNHSLPKWCRSVSVD